MGYIINNNSSTAVVTGISTESSTYGSFYSPSSGSFPAFSGDQVTGSNTILQNLKGSPYATILVFLQQGDAQISVSLDGVPYSSLNYSSGIASIQIPEQLDNGVDIQLDIDNIP